MSKHSHPKPSPVTVSHRAPLATAAAESTALNRRESDPPKDAPPVAPPAPEEKAPETGDTHTDDLPRLTPEAKAKEADLLAAQASVDAVKPVVKEPEKAKEADAVLVHNTTARLFTVALFAAVDPQRPIASSKTFPLVPGVNSVPAATWARAKAEISIQRLIDAGELTELGAKSLGELNEKQALDLVDLTVSPKLLTDWDRTEKRPKVREAIANQVVRITPARPVEEKRQKDEDEDQE